MISEGNGIKTTMAIESEITPMPQMIFVRTNQAQLIALDAELSKLRCCARCVDGLHLDPVTAADFRGLESAVAAVQSQLASFLPMPY